MEAEGGADFWKGETSNGFCSHGFWLFRLLVNFIPKEDKLCSKRITKATSLCWLLRGRGRDPVSLLPSQLISSSFKSTSHNPWAPHDTHGTPPVRVRALKQYKLHMEPLGGKPAVHIDGVTCTKSGSEMALQVTTETKIMRRKTLLANETMAMASAMVRQLSVLHSDYSDPDLPNL